LTYQSIDPKSISTLPRFKKELEKCKSEYIYSRLKFMRPYCVSYLDQLFQRNKEKNNILFLPQDRKVHKYLFQCGFEHLYGECPDTSDFEESNIIKLTRFTGTETEVEDIAVDWIKTKIFHFIPSLSSDLNKKIVKNIWEIIQNALIHSENKCGISVCGQFYPKRNYFEVAFSDFGIGIPNKVSSFMKLKKLNNDCDYIEWALHRGNSTLGKPNSGLGLYFLREFIKINQGNFQIISGNGFFGHINAPTEEKISLADRIDGTLVNMRINYN
jgi:hypothetical protein